VDGGDERPDEGALGTSGRRTSQTRLAQRQRRRGLGPKTGRPKGPRSRRAGGWCIRGTQEGALLNLLGLLKGDDEEGWAERLGDPKGQVEGSVDSGDEGCQEGALLNLGLRKGDDEEGWAERLGDPKDQIGGPVDGAVQQ